MINFGNFLHLDPEAAGLARKLVEANDEQRSTFSSFAHVWMAFNGWMECVTEAETDSAMINAIAEQVKMVAAYNQLLAEAPEFRSVVVEFAKMFPILNVRDVRKKVGRDAFYRYGRDALFKKVTLARVKHQPVGWTSGTVPSWPQVLRAVYLVRCNLFHGAKSAENFRDHQLVGFCDSILRMFIERTKCFEWSD
ncbi:MAG: hypothetical protein KF871_04865 [Hydrogenophaga sp.]|uniref:hypothetical protein n=1 Tax=Hydrogenophaga sp. TaxID=1904254 RepID=UPI001D89AA4D|nr:hypothetical protein [Hydrogenophaga sp.]MBX3609206.1 hypothetical protein [Hydrogenophaga sp.]